MVITIKKIAKVAAIISAILLVGSIVLHKQCSKPLQEVDKNDYILQPETYSPPLINIPFIKTKKQPVEDKDLPIPAKDVKTTIVVKNPVPGAEDITIIIDKKGKVYKSKDTPEDIKIEVTEWKPALFGLQSEWGIGMVMEVPLDMSITVSWDILRVWKLHFGLDLGAKLVNQGLADPWLGTSVKYKILPNNNLFVLAGYNWTHKAPYIGIMMRF